MEYSNEETSAIEIYQTPISNKKKRGKVYQIPARSAILKEQSGFQIKTKKRSIISRVTTILSS